MSLHVSLESLWAYIHELKSPGTYLRLRAIVSASYIHCMHIPLTHLPHLILHKCYQWAYDYDDGLLLHGLDASKDVEGFREQTITPSLHHFWLQTAILNLMACIACKIISGIKTM